MDWQTPVPEMRALGKKTVYSKFYCGRPLHCELLVEDDYVLSGLNP